jgi:hypothetical protein
MPRKFSEVIDCPHELWALARPPCPECQGAARMALTAIALVLTEFTDLEIRVDGLPMTLEDVRAMLEAVAAGRRAASALAPRSS